MADREYTDDEKRTLRVLKMQEGDLSRLQEQTDSHTQQLSQMDDRLSELKRRASAIAQEEGIELPEERHLPTTPTHQKEKMAVDAIPSWQSLEERADETGIPHDIVIEDLLTGKEITFAKKSQIIEEFWSVIS